MDWPPAYTHTKRVTAGSLCVTVNVACKEACPNSLNVSLGGVPVRVLVKVMLGGRLSRSRTVVSMVPSPFWSILTIQPSLQELPQLVASAGLRGQSSATRLNLMASLRVCEILASRSLAVDTVLRPDIAKTRGCNGQEDGEHRHSHEQFDQGEPQRCAGMVVFHQFQQPVVEGVLAPVCVMVRVPHTSLDCALVGTACKVKLCAAWTEKLMV